LLGQAIAASAGSQLYVITMTGHEWSAARLLIGSAAFSAAASIVLIGLIGPTGAAIATAASLVLWNATMARFLRRRLGILPGVLALLKCPIEEGSTRGRAERARS